MKILFIPHITLYFLFYYSATYFYCIFTIALLLFLNNHILNQIRTLNWEGSSIWLFASARVNVLFRPESVGQYENGKRCKNRKFGACGLKKDSYIPANGNQTKRRRGYFNKLLLLNLQIITPFFLSFG